MKKITGVLVLLVFVVLATALLRPNFVESLNLYNVLRWSSFYALIGIGVAVVIITGGIDLSIGSVMGLVGCVLPMLLVAMQKSSPALVSSRVALVLGCELAVVAVIWCSVAVALRIRRRRPLSWRPVVGLAAGSIAALALAAWLGQISLAPWLGWLVALAAALTIALHIGLVHGVLVTKLSLQPFVVTLCSLLIYRSLARWIANDQSLGYAQQYDDTLRLLATGKPCTAATFMLVGGIVLVALAAIRWIGASRAAAPAARRAWSAAWLIIGIALVTVGAARFIGGWEIQWRQPIATWGEYTLSTFRVVVPDSNAALPSHVMRWTGLALGVLGIAWYAFGLVRGKAVAATPVAAAGSASDARESNISLWLIGTGVVAGAVGVFWMFQALQLRDADTAWIADERWRGRVLIGSVVGSLGLMTGSLVTLVRAALKFGGERSRVSVMIALTGLLFGLLGFTELAKTAVPTPFIVMLVVAAFAAVLLNGTIYGRYLFALGNNLQAARLSGINTDRMVILAYVFCALCAGLGGILFSLDSGSVQPSNLGNFGELYAIAAAVLGGCSLRGGEGSIVGVIIAAAVIRVLYNSIALLTNQDELEHLVIGVVILAAVIIDELVKRLLANRRLARIRQNISPSNHTITSS
jgi:ribose/xylose/arabinose/galactoside ABC-type transport system permease subunit